MENKSQKAEALFKSGYNCAQSVCVAFAAEMKLSDEQAAKMASMFGGGLARMREVCGAVSGMALVLGVLEGYSSPNAYNEKACAYEKMQALIAAFQKENGSFICGTLLGTNKADAMELPEHRSAQYYKKRPCAELVACAAGLLQNALSDNLESACNEDSEHINSCNP